MTTKKQGRWVASKAFDPDKPGEWMARVYRQPDTYYSAEFYVDVQAPSRTECRRRAAAIRDLANKEGWE